MSMRELESELQQIQQQKAKAEKETANCRTQVKELQDKIEVMEKVGSCLMAKTGKRG